MFDLVLSILSTKAILLIASDEQIIASRSWSKKEGAEIGDEISIKINEIFLETKKDWSSVRKIYGAEGPGAFTGLRISSAYLKGLSCALKIPLVGIPTYRIFNEKFSIPLRAAKAAQMSLDEYCREGLKFLQVSGDTHFLVSAHAEGRIVGFGQESEWPHEEELFAGLCRSRELNAFELRYGYAPEFVKIQKK